MVKDVIRPLPPTAKLDWQRVANAWNFAAEAAEKTPADLAMGAGAWRRTVIQAFYRMRTISLMIVAVLFS
jgi:hypothetical protein